MTLNEAVNQVDLDQNDIPCKQLTSLDKWAGRRVFATNESASEFPWSQWPSGGGIRRDHDNRRAIPTA